MSAKTKTFKKTTIIASIGPACREKEMLQKLVEGGMNIARFNFSHADYETTARIIDDLSSMQSDQHTIGIMLDTKGPEIRTGEIEEKVNYQKGETFKIVTDSSNKKDPKTIYCDYPYLIEEVTIGQEIMIDSGLFHVTVRQKADDHIIVQAQNNATIGSKRHINLPGMKLRLPALTEKDKKDILFGIENNIDFVAVSFIRSAENVTEVRNFLDKNGGKHIHIIAKIENQEGIENLEEITLASDGVMIARGDLGVEIPIQTLPSMQKHIADICNKYGKPVIFATELLKSMVNNIFPTRSEVSDVYHAVRDGHDAIMLSDETAVGQYPLESLQILASIAIQAEQDTHFDHQDFQTQLDDPYFQDKKYSMKAAHHLADSLGADAIITFTNSGLFAHLASAYKPNVPIYAFTQDQNTKRYMTLLYGISPYILANIGKKKADHEQYAIQKLLSDGHIQSGAKIIIAYDEDDQNEKIAKVKVINIK